MFPGDLLAIVFGIITLGKLGVYGCFERWRRQAPPQRPTARTMQQIVGGVLACCLFGTIGVVVSQEDTSRLALGATCVGLIVFHIEAWFVHGSQLEGIAQQADADALVALFRVGR